MRMILARAFAFLGWARAVLAAQQCALEDVETVNALPREITPLDAESVEDFTSKDGIEKES